jgi:thiol-disulfide isomerase/thioredoxin
MVGFHPISRRTALVLFGSAKLFAIDTREPAPKFHAKSLDGEKFNNESVKGKAVLVQFWATWCHYCKRDESAVDTIAEDYASKGLIVLAVDVREPRKKVERYLQGSPRACKIVLMDDTNLAAMFAAKAFPLYVLIDQNGKIAGTLKGSVGEDGLRRLLKKVISSDEN